MRLRYFAAGALAFVLCGFGIPGPQGSAGGGVSEGSSPTFADVDVDSLTLSTGSFTTVALDLYANRAIELTPASSGAMTIRAASGNALTLASLSANLNLSVQGSGALSFLASGGINLTGSDATGDEVRIGALSPLLWTDGRADNGTGDLYLRRSAASTLTVDSDGTGGAATLIVSKFQPDPSDTDTYLDRPGANVMRFVVGNKVMQFDDGHLRIPEITAPTGTANTAKIYAKDNGAGKTQLVVIFGSGAEQVLATEP